jgi:hypothetical protein
MVQKQGPNWGYWAQNAVKVVKFIVYFDKKRCQSMQIYQNCVFPNWGYRAQNGVIIGLYGPKTVPK